MAAYKVIQDIEAEDKLLGPFGIRQFVYLIIVFVSGFIIFKLLLTAWFLAIPLIPHTIFFTLLALPVGGEQPTEAWLLGKIRFLIKPKVRIWDQSGTKDLVTITAPKKEEKKLTHDISQHEVKSRLEALANTLDSRGWAIKNVNINVFTPAYAGMPVMESDRLVELSNDNQEVSDYSITAMDDMFDERNNPRAQNLDQLINTAATAHREQIKNNMHNTALSMQAAGSAAASQTSSGIQQVNSDYTQQSSQQSAQTPSQQSNYWFTQQNSQNYPQAAPYAYADNLASASPAQIVIPDSPAQPQADTGLPLQPLAPSSEPISEQELLDKIHAEQDLKSMGHGNLKVIKTLEEQETEAKEKTENDNNSGKSMSKSIVDEPMTTPPSPDIIELARNDDLSVATVSRQAKKSKHKDLPDGEVVINLHD